MPSQAVPSALILSAERSPDDFVEPEPPSPDDFVEPEPPSPLWPASKGGAWNA